MKICCTGLIFEAVNTNCCNKPLLLNYYCSYLLVFFPLFSLDKQVTRFFICLNFPQFILILHIYLGESFQEPIEKGYQMLHIFVSYFFYFFLFCATLFITHNSFQLVIQIGFMVIFQGRLFHGNPRFSLDRHMNFHVYFAGM